MRDRDPAKLERLGLRSVTALAARQPLPVTLPVRSAPALHWSCSVAKFRTGRPKSGTGAVVGYAIRAFISARRRTRARKTVAMIFNYQFPDSAEGGHLAWGRSKRVSAMTRKGITFEFVAPTVLTAVLGTALLIGAIYLTNRHLGPLDQSEANQSVAGSHGMAELTKPNGRFSRVHLLLSGMR
jgi:hypothetical protein